VQLLGRVLRRTECVAKVGLFAAYRPGRNQSARRTCSRPSECSTSPGNQSGGLYFLSGQGTLLVHVSWDKRTVTAFTVTHSGHAKYLGGTVPPQYAKVTVAGVSAYWQLSPAPGPGNTQSVSSLKRGYVVTFTSMGLSHSEVDQALAVTLDHL